MYMKVSKFSHETKSWSQQHAPGQIQQMGLNQHAFFFILQHPLRNKIPSRNISGFGPPGIKFPDKEKSQEPVVTIPSLEFEQDIVSICFL